jgi:hypothetical protein
MAMDKEKPPKAPGRASIRQILNAEWAAARVA